MYSIQSKIKPNDKNFVHLVGLHTYYNMMRGAYNLLYPVSYYAYNSLISEVLSFQNSVHVPCKGLVLSIIDFQD